HAILASSTEQWNEARQNPADPFHVWAVLLQAPAADFSTRREELRKQLSGLGEQPPETELFEDFNTGLFDDWFITGWAFGSGPTRPGQWNATRDNFPLTHSGVAHSGLLSNKLRGVLRS